MTAVLRGRAWRFGDNVDTDQIIPAKYAIFSLDEKKLGEHAMEGVPGNEGWSQRVAPGDIVVGGSNFGIRSHRGEKIQKIKKCQRPPRLASASIGFNQGYRAVRPRISSMIAVLASA